LLMESFGAPRVNVGKNNDHPSKSFMWNACSSAGHGAARHPSGARPRKCIITTALSRASSRKPRPCLHGNDLSLSRFVNTRSPRPGTRGDVSTPDVALPEVFVQRVSHFSCNADSPRAHDHATRDMRNPNERDVP
jgi:hypothetical protein